MLPFAGREAHCTGIFAREPFLYGPARRGAQASAMWFQPIVYFAAVTWSVVFVLFGIYLLFRRGPARFTERVMDLIVALVVAGVGAGLFVGGLYLFEELL
jgi:hypothetical protein